jgi:hypothetical protein
VMRAWRSIGGLRRVDSWTNAAHLNWTLAKKKENVPPTPPAGASLSLLTCCYSIGAWRTSLVLTEEAV